MIFDAQYSFNQVVTGLVVVVLCGFGIPATGSTQPIPKSGGQSSRLSIRFGDESASGAWQCRCGWIRQLTSGVGDDTEAVWSPDGKTIAFQTDRHGDLDIATLDLTNNTLDFIVAGAGHACYPAWTPDGALLYAFGNHVGTAVQAAAMQADWGYGLRLRRAGITTVLTQGYWRDYTPSMAPNNQTVIFASTRGESVEGVGLWQVTLTAGAPVSAPTQVLTGRGGLLQPSFSPDGRLLLWAQQNGFRDNWCLCAAVATNLHGYTFLTPPEMSAYAPRWSPDGRLIAFTGFREGEQGWGIYVTEPRSGAMSRLQTGEGNSKSPAWSPDGRELVFENNRTGNYKLYRTQLSCKGAVEISPSEGTNPYRIEARLERLNGTADLINAMGQRISGTLVGNSNALFFTNPSGLDFGSQAFFVRMTLTIDGAANGSRIAAVGSYAGQMMGWQVFVSEDQRVWFNARNVQGVFIGAQSDKPVAFNQPINVLGIRYADGLVRLYLNDQPQQHYGAGATMVYGAAQKVCLGAQHNGTTPLNGQILAFECGRGYPVGVPHPISRAELFGIATTTEL